jgi:hypothetical protein
VSDLGWAGELPDDIVCKAAADISDIDLATVIISLLEAPHRMIAISQRARAFARTQSFDRSARALLSILSDFDRSPAR